jgi:hypothetical protein
MIGEVRRLWAFANKIARELLKEQDAQETTQSTERIGSKACSVFFSTLHALSSMCLVQGLSMKRRILMFISMATPIRLVTRAVPP